jgi:hypothetical protein
LTPDAVQVIARHSSHYVMFSQPELIIEPVRRLVDAVPGEPQPVYSTVP